MSTPTSICLLILCLAMQAGCTFDRDVDLDPPLELPIAVRSLPVTMGVYYSSEFVQFSVKEALTCTAQRGQEPLVRYVFPVGTASRTVLDKVFSSMFDHVKTLSDPGNETLPAEMVGYIEPRVEWFHWGLACTTAWPTRPRYKASVGYHMIVHNRDGTEIATLSIQGRGTETVRFCFHDCKDSIVTERTILDGIAAFVLAFNASEQVSSWLAEHGVTRTGSLR